MSGFYFERKKHHHSLLKNQQIHGPQNVQKPWLVLAHPKLDMMPLQEKKSKTHVISTGNAIVFGLEVHIPVINCGCLHVYDPKAIVNNLVKTGH